MRPPRQDDVRSSPPLRPEPGLKHFWWGFLLAQVSVVMAFTNSTTPSDPHFGWWVAAFAVTQLLFVAAVLEAFGPGRRRRGGQRGPGDS